MNTPLSDDEGLKLFESKRWVTGVPSLSLTSRSRGSPYRPLGLMQARLYRTSSGPAAPACPTTGWLPLHSSYRRGAVENLREVVRLFSERPQVETDQGPGATGRPPG